MDHNGLDKFDRIIDGKIVDFGFHKIKVQYVNAKHLVWRQPESQLTETVTNLVMRLLDEYMPIDILDIGHISEGEAILRDIEKSLDENEQVDVNLSKQFYQCIPQNDFAERIEVINDRNAYESKRDALACLHLALEVIQAGVQSTINPIDYFTRNWLHTELNEIDHASVEFSQLEMCVEATQHDRFFRLANAFKVTSPADIHYKYEMFNQCLLYHFVFPCKILSILRDGLQVSSNRGGFYFWDSASLALDKFKDDLYRKTPPVLLVCRVARGAVKKVDFDDNSLLPLSEDSFFWRGREFAGIRSATVSFGNAKMFCGEVERFCGRVTNDSNKYNVSMVGSRDQVKIEYILQFDRN